MTDDNTSAPRRRRLIVDDPAAAGSRPARRAPEDGVSGDRRLEEDSPASKEALSPQDAPAPDADADAAPAPIAAMRTRLSFWLKLFLSLGAALVSLSVMLWADRLYRDAAATAPWLGWAALALLGAFGLAALVVVGRELAALGRLRRVSALRAQATAARAPGASPQQAKAVAAALAALYRGRRDLAWSKAKYWSALADRADDQVDAGARLDLYEREVVGRLDATARLEIERAARRVATATALMPSALLDALAALTINLMMIRRIAEIYGGRASLIGSLGLARRVVQHAMAAGLIEIGGDLLGPLLGGGLAGGASRRVGEGVVNGAMTVRIGIACAELCRPLPYVAAPKPRLRDLAFGALRGVKLTRES